MPLQLVTPPAEEPVSLAEAKLHLRVDFSDDDALITGLIASARAHAEMLTRRQLVTARWKAIFDGLDCALVLPRSPLQTVTGIEYRDTGGGLQTLPVTEYVVDASEPARITPAFGKTWPATLPQIGVVAVTFDAGYGSAADVPDGIKTWIKLRVGSLYAHREEAPVLTRGKVETLAFVDGLLDPYKVATV